MHPVWFNLESDMHSEKLWPLVIGQPRVKHFLARAIESGRVPHAYLFSGPDGVGKDAMAIEFARTLNCLNDNLILCGNCDSCLKMNSLQHPNVSLIFALPTGKGSEGGPLDGLSTSEIELIQNEIQLKARNPYHNIQIPKANEIRVASIRQLKTSNSYYAYTSGKKFFIIFDADKMNDEAANSLLKTLEEPNENTIIVLTTAHQEKLLPTIISRCQILRFDLLTDQDIVTALMERENVESVKAQTIANMAQGSYSRALELIDENLKIEQEQAVNFVRAALTKSPTNILTIVDQVVDGIDRPGAERWLAMLQLWFRDVLLLKEAGDGVIANIDQIETIRNFLRRFEKANVSEAIELVDQSIALVRKNVYLPLIFTNLAINLRSVLSN